MLVKAQCNCCNTKPRINCVQVTKRITRHPVCMTVYGVKPPCLPADLHIGHSVTGGPDCWKRNDSPEEASLWEDDQQEGLYIEPTSVLRWVLESALVLGMYVMNGDKNAAPVHPPIIDYSIYRYSHNHRTSINRR